MPPHRPALTVGAIAAAVLVATVTSVWALDEELQFSGVVTVVADGNGWVAARFPTTIDGIDVAYFLDIWTGCADEPELEGDQSCPPAVKALAVTLNGEVVFQATSAFRTERAEIALHLVGTADNEIMVSADGNLSAAARFAVVAVRGTPRQP